MLLLEPITRGTLAKKLGGMPFTLRYVDFGDLARGGAYFLTLTAPVSGDWQRAKEIARGRSYRGCRIIVSG